MISAFFNGIVLGLLLAILIGPVFFALIETSIRKGILFGIYLSIGIVVSDASYILITYAGISQWINNEHFKIILGGAGGMIMIITGISAIIKKQHYDHLDPKFKESTSSDKLKNILKGFVLNSLNPAVLLFWIGAVSYVTVTLKYNTNAATAFFLGTLAITFTTDLGKIYIANRLSKLLTDNLILRLNQIAGLGLITFGIKLIYEVLI